MAGRRGVGRPSAKRVAPTATGGKKSSKTSSSATASLSSLARQDQRRSCRDVRPGEAGAATPEEEEEEVTLLYRKPSTRHAPGTEAGLSSSSAPQHTADSSVASPESSVLTFLKRATGPVNLSHYLAHCGVCDAQLRSGDEGFRVSQQQIFQCSHDRLVTAVQALRNMEALIFTPVDTSTASGTPCVGQACWVRPAHQMAMVALARVCEAAVPLQLPSLVQSVKGAIAEHGESNDGVSIRSSSLAWTLPLALAGAPRSKCTHMESDLAEGKTEKRGDDVATVSLVPSPVRLLDVQHRLHRLRRLHELRVAYGEILPRLHAARTLPEVCQQLFAHDDEACRTLGRLRQLCTAQGTSSAPDNAHPTSSEVTEMPAGQGGAAATHTRALADVLSSFLGSPTALDTLLPLAGISSRHPQEEALLQHFVELLKETTIVEAAAWGPMAAMSSWRCSDGMYVVQHASRVRALRRLLAEANFYGLPRFLRSIRTAANGNTAASGLRGEGGWTGVSTAAVQRAQGCYADCFFLTPDALDPASFTQPDSMQLQLVWEELITLQRSHCAFCLVVGEADEVVLLLQRHLHFAGQAWSHLVKKKKEEEVVVKREPSFEECADGEGAADVGRADSRSAVTGGCELVDPLNRYALRTVEAARRCERAKKAQPATTASTSAPGAAVALPFSHVQWVRGGGGGTNRWSPNTHYYGLAYMVVMETDEWDTDESSLMTEGLLPGTAIAVSDGDAAAALRPPQPVTYCVNALLELWRS